MKLQIFAASAFYLIEQITDQGNAQRPKSLRLKRELHWLKTLGTQFPNDMNHKTRENVIYSSYFHTAAMPEKAFNITTNIYTKLQAKYPNVLKGQLMCS